jgi:hypothetical protein
MPIAIMATGIADGSWSVLARLRDVRCDIVPGRGSNACSFRRTCGCQPKVALNNVRPGTSAVTSNRCSP